MRDYQIKVIYLRLWYTKDHMKLSIKVLWSDNRLEISKEFQYHESDSGNQSETLGADKLEENGVAEHKN